MDRVLSTLISECKQIRKKTDGVREVNDYGAPFAFNICLLNHQIVEKSACWFLMNSAR